MKSDFILAVTQLASERHLPREQVMEAIEAGLASAFKKDSFAPGQNISVKLDPSTGEIAIYTVKTVVETVEDPLREITVKGALKIKKDSGVGDTVALQAPPHETSRIAAQTAKQVVLQKLREAERELIYQEFEQRTDEVVSGVVDQFEVGKVIVLELGRVQAVLPLEEQVPTERYRKGQRLKVYVVEVSRTPKGPEIVVSRSHKNLLKRLFEIEVPEVFNGIVEIKSVAREAGARSKVAVASNQQGLDPVGSCIGMRGNRIQSIVSELQGEKIDVVRWDKDIKVLISNALSPSEVVHVELDEQDGSATVVVPERQLSLAIGKEGQNARLAAKLTGWRLDIKSMSEWGAIKAQLVTQQVEEEAMAPAEVVEEEPVVMATEPEEVPAAEEVPQPVEVGAIAASVEEVLAEALIKDEEAVQTEPAAAEAKPTLSPEEELAALAFEEDESEVEDEEEVVPEELGEDIWATPALSPDAGKIRFAEDILGDERGRGKRRAKGKGASRSGGQDKKRSAVRTELGGR